MLRLGVALCGVEIVCSLTGFIILFEPHGELELIGLKIFYLFELSDEFVGLLEGFLWDVGVDSLTHLREYSNNKFKS